MTAWLDTRGVDRPPADNVWQQARWLVGRSPRVQVLCERVRAVDDEGDERWPHIEMLADIICAYDGHGRAYEAYRRSYYPPDDDARFEAWEARGPKVEDAAALFNLATPGGIRAYGPMSSGEKKLLRILATLGTHRVEFSTADLDGLDDEGHAFIRDWVKIVLA